MFYITNCVTTEKFWSPHNWQQNAFSCHKLGDRKHSVTNHVVIKLIFGHHMFTDLGHLINSGLISTIDLATNFDLVTKFGLPSNKM